MRLVLDGGPVGLADFVRASGGPVEVVLTPPVRQRLAAARAVVDGFAAGPAPVYGLNTGLGGNLGHRIAPDEMPAFQAQLLAGRTVGIGPPLDERVSRAALLARVIGASKGAAGLSPAVIALMIAMLGRGMAPVIAGRGSIGAGDLALGAQMGATLIGAGEIWHEGRRRPAGEALAAAGLAPAALGSKDALALANHSAVTVASAALALDASRAQLRRAMAVAALAAEGYAMNAGIFDPRLQALRPAAGQVAAAAWFRRALIGSDLARPGAARAIQDALSFRTLAPVFGAAMGALEAAEREVAVELDASADNPAVLGQGPEAEMLSTANFHTASIALAFDALAIAQVQVASASAQRVVKLMAPQLSGLAKYLSPVGGASAGFMPMQKTVAALLAEIRLRATPASGDAMPVSEMVEDVAPQTPLTIAKLDEQREPLAWLAAIEAAVAAQAVSLRAPTALGRVPGVLMAAIRAAVPPLGPDRATGADLAPVRAAIEDPAVAAAWEALDAAP